VPFRRTRQSFPSRRRPNRSWAGFANTGLITVGVSTKVLITSFSLSNPNIDETLLRHVGRLLVQSDQLAASELNIGAMGGIIVTDLAIAAGAASIPGPVTDRADDGWYLYVPIVQNIRVADATGFSNGTAGVYDFDSKAKRKLQEGQQLAIMVENASASFAFQMAMVFRSLSMVSGT